MKKRPLRPKRHKTYVPFYKKRPRYKKSNRNWDDPRYIAFRQKVLDRDNHKCVICGSGYNIEVHHYVNWSSCVAGRYLVSNAVSVCKKHHRQFHARYTKTNNTRAQFVQFRMSLCPPNQS